LFAKSVGQFVHPWSRLALLCVLIHEYPFGPPTKWFIAFI
jgi:hypothetical protein